MANIKIKSPEPLYDGMAVSFKAPCACTEVEGLAVTYNYTETVFTFKDAHGNTLTGIGNLFAEGAVIKVLLDVENSSAYLQNADTNGYIESRWTKKNTATLAADSWVFDGEEIYTQTIQVSGVTANTLVALQPSAEQMVAMKRAGASFITVDNDDGEVIVSIGSAAPSTDMVIQLTLTEVSV